MATDDTSLKTEVRSLTDYDSLILSEDDLQAVVDIAKRELYADLGDESLNLYDTLNSERALFWLTCIFCKVKSGEIDGVSFNIGELDVDSFNPHTSVGIWMNNFWKHYRGIEGGAPVAHTRSNRPDRNYGFDNSATRGNL
jgi:hypothetical protein